MNLQLLYETLEILARSLFHHDVNHLLPDVPDLRTLRVTSFLLLPLHLRGERDAEEAEDVACESGRKRKR
jgi:hypothetical protein